MRTKDTFEFTCLCGAVVTSEEPQLRCPKCNRLIRLVWREEELNHEPVP